MNSIILCEGETDQALIGCYMERVAGWKFTKIAKDNPLPQESITWYLNKEGKLDGIWQVGGNDFTGAIQSIFKRELLEHCFDKVVIITDHDDDIAEQDRLTDIRKRIEITLGENFDSESLSINEWNGVSFHNPFGNFEIRFLYLLVPKDEFGALETYMMNAISEQSPEKKHVISESKKFVNEFQSDIYLKKRREKIKAELGVSLSIFSPDRIFTTMKELIDSVEWENYTETHKQFELLIDLYE